MTESTTRHYGTPVAALLAGWSLLVLSASALSLFRTSEHAASVPLITAALVPVAAFGLWAAASASFRRYALALDPRLATLVHAWRAAGFMFLVLAAYGVLPRTFALPAGWGDIAIGITAPFVAAYLATPRHRKVFIAWHVVGLLDLVMAITLGILSTTRDPGVGMAAMAVLPLSIVPSLIVPLLAVAHIIAIAGAVSWTSPGNETVRPAAVAAGWGSR
jgi:hypothetical protein